MNDFTKVPQALAPITVLVTLNMSLNSGLELEEDTIKVIAAMPKLESFPVAKSIDAILSKEKKGGLSEASLSVLIAIKAQFPELEVPDIHL